MEAKKLDEDMGEKVIAEAPDNDSDAKAANVTTYLLRPPDIGTPTKTKAQSPPPFAFLFSFPSPTTCPPRHHLIRAWACHVRGLLPHHWEQRQGSEGAYIGFGQKRLLHIPTPQPSAG